MAKHNCGFSLTFKAIGGYEYAWLIKEVGFCGKLPNLPPFVLLLLPFGSLYQSTQSFYAYYEFLFTLSRSSRTFALLLTGLLNIAIW